MATNTLIDRRRRDHAPVRQLCTFSVDDLFLGVDVLDVQEVIRHQDMTPVPLAPGEIRGLINLRGQIVTAVDLGSRLGLSARTADTDRAPGDRSLNVVVRTPDGPTSLLVDAIGDVTDVTRDLLEEPPATLPASAASVIEGIYKLDGRLLLALDLTAQLRLGP